MSASEKTSENDRPMPSESEISSSAQDTYNGSPVDIDQRLKTESRFVPPARSRRWHERFRRPFSGRSAWNCVRGFMAAMLLATVMLPFLPASQFQGFLLDVWHEVLLLLFVVLDIAFLLHRRSARCAAGHGSTSVPAGRISWAEAALWNSAAILAMVLHLHGAVRPAVGWLMMTGLRFCLPTAWIAVILGFPIVCRHILDRRNRPVSKWVKRWFSLSLLIVSGESTSLLLLRSANSIEPLAFPEQLTAPGDGSLHIAATGGSTMLGWPWQPRYSIAGVAAWQLERPEIRDSGSAASDTAGVVPQHQSCKVVLHNVARAGAGLRQDVEQLHSLTVRPHVLLVYTGHNEIYHDVDFTLRTGGSSMSMVDQVLSVSPAFRLIDGLLTQRFSSLWRFVQRERRLVDDAYLTDEQRDHRLAIFRDRLRQLSQFCQRQGIRLILFLPAGAESSCPPNRSFVNSNNSSSAEGDIATAWRVAVRHEEQHEWSLAAGICEAQLREHPEMAEFHFRLGHCLLQLNRPQQAEQHFQSALETDGFPVRAQADYRRVIELVASEFGTPVIETAEILRAMAPHGILDDTVFLDDVHPTLRATYALGTATADSVQALVADEFSELRSSPHGSFHESLSGLKMDPMAISAGYELTAGVMLNRACLRFDHSHWKSLGDRLRTAAESLRNADSIPEHTGIESLDDFHWPLEPDPRSIGSP